MQQGSESLLAQRVRSRHEKALTDFITAVRETHNDHDRQASTIISNLREVVQASSEERISTVCAHKNALSAFRNIVSTTTAQFVSGGECPLLEDELHTAGSDSLLVRNENVIAKKREILYLAKECFRRHGELMDTIAKAHTDLKRVEASRASSTRGLLDVLGNAVAAAAYVNETELQVIVQKATHSVNRILLQNHNNINVTISGLRQTEILSTRECLCVVADLFNDQLAVMRDSILLWTFQYLSGHTFHKPQHRQELLFGLGLSNSKIKSEVQQALRGLSALADTLQVVREGSEALETCGGTAQNGWLRFFVDDFHKPLFSRSPHAVTSEWDAFLGVIIRNAKCNSLSLLESFAAAEKALVAESERIRSTTAEQLKSLFTLTTEETADILSCCLSDEFRFPLNTIKDRPDLLESSILEMNTIITPVLEQIRVNGQKFLTILAESANLRTEELAGVLSSNCNSVISYVSEVTSELENISDRSLTKVRQFYLTQEERTFDFDDTTNKLEKTYKSIVASLQRAGTVTDADLLFAKGMSVLNQLEESYHSYHHDCVGPMEGNESELRRLLREEKGRIFEILRAGADGSSAEGSFIGADGARYYFRQGEWRFPSQMPPPSPPSLPPTPEIVVTQKKGKAPTKKPTREAELPPPQAVVAYEPPPDPIALAFRSEIEKALPSECFVSSEHVREFLTTLRTSFAKWVLSLELNATGSFVSYCKKRRESLSRHVNELIRRHQRRAPSLQSGTYELRIRELQSSQQNRQRQLEGFEHRMRAMISMIEASIEDSKDIAHENASQLESAAQNVANFTTRQVLETHVRSFADLMRKMRSAVDARKETIFRHLQNSLDSIAGDCENFKTNGTRTFEQGGTITEVEKRESLNAIGDFMERLSTVEEELKEKISARSSLEHRMLSEASARNDEACAQCVSELDFFASITNVLSELKGKVYNTIMANENTNSRLDGLISDFEKAVRRRDDGEKSYLSFGTCVQSAKETYGSSYQNIDEDLSSRLRQTQAETSLAFQESRAQRILEAMMALRLPLLNRGATLDALKHTVELHKIYRDLLVDPSEDIIGVLLAPPPQAAAVAAKKTKAPVVKEVKVAAAAPPQAPTTPIFVAPEGHIATTQDVVSLPQTLISDTEVLCQSAQRRIDELILEHTAHSQVIRGSILGGTSADELSRSASGRIHLHLKKIEDYSEDGRTKYREQVQRVLIVVSDAADEIFRCLQYVCSKSVSSKLECVLKSFYAFYNPMAGKRKRHDQLLKGCLAAPSNRGALTALVTDEAARQEAAQKAIKTLWAVSLREIQAEARLMAMRCLVSLQSFFWLSKGLITPPHLVPGGAAALGEHKGLRRLLKKGEQLAQTTQVEIAAITEAKPSVSGGPPQSKTDKGKKQQPLKEPEPIAKFELTPLETPLCVYEGVDPEKLRMFDLFIEHSTETAKALVNHYLLPSQWAIVPQVIEAPPTEIVPKKDAKGKKGAAAATTSTPAVSAPAKQQLVCAHHRAPASQQYQSAFLSRERAIEIMRNAMQHAANDATKHFAGILLDERQWTHSWNDAIGRL